MKISFDRDTLKIIAIIAMTIDHIAAAFFRDAGYLYLFMRSIGAITFPVMALMVGQGYKKCRSLKKYKIRLLIFSVASMIPFAYAFGINTYGLNVGFTMLCGLYMIEVYDKVKNNGLKWSVIVLLCLLSFEFDWGFFGAGLILFLYIADGRKKYIILSLVLTIVLFVLRNQIYFFIKYARLIPFETIISANAFLRFIGFIPVCWIIFNYNGIYKKSMKYLYYIYYPLHLMILGIITHLVK